MKINRISWSNFKSLTDGSIDADGHNVTITGRNGAGKSSIASILPFILFGKVTGSVKCYDNGSAPQDDGLIHAAVVSFDDGSTLRREYFWLNGGNRQKFYINGKAVNQSAFKVHVEKITHGGGEVVINPFAFCNLKAAEQRDILTYAFATVTDADLLATEFPELRELLDGQSVDEFANRSKIKMRSLKAEAAEIPGRIDELQRQISADDVQAESAKIIAELDALQHERAKLSNRKPCDFNYESALAQKQLADVDARINRRQLELNASRDRLQALRREYARVKKLKNICPTCGQSLPPEQYNKSLAVIEAAGKRLNAEVGEHEKILAELANERLTIENQIANLQEAATSQAQENFAEKINRIDQSINALVDRKAQLQHQAEILDRIQTLRQLERDLNQQILQIDSQLNDAKIFTQRKIQLVEDSIDSHFEHVHFKLFDYLVTTGEVRPTCEATLDGVPYVALSKGEKLRAALDIFRALQRAFNVELPVMLDDAESYTPNSFINIPNQIFAFKVTDDDLSVTVNKEAQS